MSTKAQIRAGLVARLRTITGLNVYETWPESAAPPAAFPAFRSEAFDADMDEGRVQQWDVIVAVPLQASGPAWQAELDTYGDASGAKSVRAALDADPTLGGVADSLRVVSASEGQIDIAGVPHVAVLVRVEIYAS